MPVRIRLAVVLLLVTMSTLAAPFTEAAAAVEPGPKRKEFDRVFSEWKALLGELQELRQQYRTAEPNRRTQIKTRYDQLLEQGERLQPQLIEAAENAFVEAPNRDHELTQFLAQTVVLQLASDDYERALPLAETLIRRKAEAPAMYAFAGLAAFAVGQFDDSQKYFTAAEENYALDALLALDSVGEHALANFGEHYRQTLSYYQQVWPREQQLRAAEAEADDLPRVLLRTNKGDIEVELFENEAPNTVANFISLVEKGFYDGLVFHRVLPGFMAQGGCPRGDGTGGPGYHIRCECTRADHRLHFRGSLSMAHTGERDTGGSQFFITFVPTRHLDGKHTVFGRVVDGMDVLSKIQRRDPEKPAPPEPDRVLEAKVLRKRDHPYEPEKIGT